MVSTAERDGELIADLDSQRAQLCEPQMMWVAWMTPANNTRLGSHKTEMGFVAPAFGLG